MNKLVIIVAVLLMTGNVFAQAPEKMSYQAVIRDASNTLVTNQTVGMQISILQGSFSGTPVYEETQMPMSNTNGLVTLEIGTGTVVSGAFNMIDWSNGPYFVKTETDPTGGTTYTITGTSQLMSVPYALHANTADSIVGGLNITETDPLFAASIANGITALDTANWNSHTVDTDTQLDEAAVDAFVANNGYLTTEIDGSITNEIELPTGGTNGQVLKTDGSGNYAWTDQTVDTDTDTQLDEAAVDAFVANNGYLTTEIDGSITNEIELPTGGTNGQVLKTDGSGNYAWIDQTVDTDTDTQLDSIGIAALGFVAGPKNTALIYKGAARAKNEGSPNPNANNEIPTGVATAIPWTWVSENYQNSIAGTNNTDITIPAGVHYIRINAVITFDQNSANTQAGGRAQFIVDKNGNPFIGLSNSGYMTYQYFNFAYSHNYHSTLIPVTAGDVFNIKVFHNSGTSLYLNWGSISSAISFEFYENPN